jgi:hypothetical protein
MKCGGRQRLCGWFAVRGGLLEGATISDEDEGKHCQTGAFPYGEGKSDTVDRFDVGEHQDEPCCAESDEPSDGKSLSVCSSGVHLCGEERSETETNASTAEYRCSLRRREFRSIHGGHQRYEQ